MIQVHKLEARNTGRLQALYRRFSDRAAQDYGWTHAPIDFDTLTFALRQNIMSGYFLTLNDPASEPVGLMLYRLEEHRALEVNLIYLESQIPGKAALDVLMPRFVQDACKIDGWDVVSYALLGVQADFVLTLPWYGFLPVGQTIFKFDMLNVLSVQVFKKQAFPPLAPEYRILSWKDAGGSPPHPLAACIYEAFHQTVDTLWDPRFRSVEGCRSVVDLLISGAMGSLLPEATQLAFEGNDLVGFCFFLKSDKTSVNVPLVGINPQAKGLGLGSRMLWQGINRLMASALDSRTDFFSVDATTDTDNFPAIKMYRRLGFNEEQNYPHVYLTREKAQRYAPGKWC
jgi:GNAT superfamily N-acetyltransferase